MNDGLYWLDEAIFHVELAISCVTKAEEKKVGGFASEKARQHLYEGWYLLKDRQGNLRKRKNEL